MKGVQNVTAAARAACAGHRQQQVLVLPLVVLLLAGLATRDASAVREPAGRLQTQAATISGQVENVRFVVRGGVVTVYYDLLAGDPNTKFTVSLLVSRDGGRTYDLTAKTVSGDVGPGVQKGSEKRIVWEAGQDVERLDPDQFRYRIIIEGPLPPAGRPAAPSREAAPAAATSTIAVATDPPGAIVYLDGKDVGRTPVTLEEVAAGPHRVRLVKEGYLENSRELTVVARRAEQLSVVMTPVPAASGSGAQAEKKGGGMVKWLIPVAAAGGVGVALAAKGGGGGSSTPPPPPANNPPTIGSVTASPSGETGIESLTAFTFTAQNVADLDGDTVNVQWQFGDGTTATGLTASHTYTRSATFEVTATATDGKGGASSPRTQSVTVANLNGSWSNVYDNQTRVFTLTQNGTALSGTYTNTGLSGVTATVTGQVSTPRSITLTASGGGITPVSITGAVGPTCTWFEGLVSGGGAAGQTLRFVKQ